MATLPDNREEIDVSIRRAERADLLAIHRIEKTVFEQPWPYSAFERFLDEKGFLVATINGAVVGYVVSDLMANYGRDIGHIKDIAVHPDAQGFGVGRKLVRRSLLSLFVDGAAVTKLEVREGNEKAKALYYSEGFSRIRRIPRYYDDGEAALVLTVDMNRWGRH
ncbi:ribosomal protein S18-alanine N-acetyltransferase [Natronocalculus amylovorans]|uniref:ribosomal protein S18-alanine N-acetyltransferase n=1 Tax=Natronocalculus amylovorans TaxID=2917812 RepID=UPI003CCC9B03